MAKKFYTYTSDNGATCVIKLDEFYGGQAAFGFTAATGSTIGALPLWRSFKPRHAMVVTAAGVVRRIPCGTAVAAAYTNAATACNVRVAGATTAAKSYGHEGEKLVNSKSLAAFD